MADKQTLTTNNDFTCMPCAKDKCSRDPLHDPTWHMGKCVFCSSITFVTQIRDFGGLRE